jgi:hypothetical protein
VPALTDPLVRAAAELLEPLDWDVSLVSVLRVLLLSVYDLLYFTGELCLCHELYIMDIEQSATP